MILSQDLKKENEHDGLQDQKNNKYSENFNPNILAKSLFSIISECKNTSKENE